LESAGTENKAENDTRSNCKFTRHAYDAGTDICGGWNHCGRYI